MRHMTKQELLMVQAKGGVIPQPPPDHTRMLAETAIASMKDAVNHNDYVMAEVIKLISPRPVRFDVHRDNMGNIESVIPIYERGK